MANKKLLVGLAAGVLAITAVASVSVSNSVPMFGAMADEATYSVTLDGDNATTLLATSTGGASVQFAQEGLTAVEGKLGTLAANGYITLADGYSLNNLKSFAVTCDNHEAIELSYGFVEGTMVREGLEGWVPSTPGAESLLNEHPNYIKLTANDEVTIDEITFTYTAVSGLCNSPVSLPAKYNPTSWQIVGAHNGWSTSTGTKFTLNTKNESMDYVEFMAKVEMAKNGEFKIINGTNWDSFKTLSIEGTAIPSQISIPTDRNNNAKANFGHEYTFYLRVPYTSSTVSVYISALTNPVEKDDTNTTKVYFEKPASWGTTVYAHYWDDYGAGTTWPGVALQAEDDLLYLEYNIEYYTNILFHDNTNANKTADLLSPTDDVNVKYVIGAGWVEKDFSEEVSTDVNIYVDISATSWTKVNIYMWGGSAAGFSWPGKAMTLVSGKIYKYTTFQFGEYVNVIFNNGSKQTADLKLPTSAGDWLFTLNPNGSNGSWSEYTA